MSMSEQQLDRELGAAVAWARVVEVGEAGYYAIVPAAIYGRHGEAENAVEHIWLGRTFATALQALRSRFHTQPID